MQETLSAKLTGIRPLLMHNGRLADPTDKFTQAIKQLKLKTDDDRLQMRQHEWLGGLYLDPDGCPAITEDAILGCVVSGAAAAKKGKQIKAGVMGASAHFKLEYSGPRDIMKLYETPGFCDYRRAVIKRASIMRARPRFDKWSVTVNLFVETSIINVADVRTALELGGRSIGLGDFRPRFGRFEVQA